MSIALSLLILVMSIVLCFYCITQVILELKKTENFTRYLIHFGGAVVCFIGFLISLFELIIAFK